MVHSRRRRVIVEDGNGVGVWTTGGGSPVSPVSPVLVPPGHRVKSALYAVQGPFGANAHFWHVRWTRLDDLFIWRIWFVVTRSLPLGCARLAVDVDLRVRFVTGHIAMALPVFKMHAIVFFQLDSLFSHKPGLTQLLFSSPRQHKNPQT